MSGNAQKIRKLPPTGSREGGTESQVPVWDEEGEWGGSSTPSLGVSSAPCWSPCCPILHRARRKIIMYLTKEKADKIVAAISQFIETD